LQGPRQQADSPKMHMGLGQQAPAVVRGNDQLRGNAAEILQGGEGVTEVLERVEASEGIECIVWKREVLSVGANQLGLAAGFAQAQLSDD
jgi:hypothetical protein